MFTAIVLHCAIITGAVGLEVVSYADCAVLHTADFYKTREECEEILDTEVFEYLKERRRHTVAVKCLDWGEGV